MQVNFDLILQKGTLYVPASKHYSQMGYVSVQCDKCHKDGIQSSIGYNNYDLCLSCAADVERKRLGVFPPPPVAISDPFNIKHLPIHKKVEIDSTEYDNLMKSRAKLPP